MLRKFISGSLVAALMAGTASADTLREALVSAYNTNPTLTAQRQALEATDATVAIARAAGRPQISANVGVNRAITQSGILVSGGKGPNLTVEANVSYPLFNGGSVKNSVKAAQTRVEAGRATLRAVEGDLFTQAVAADMDVIRDRAIFELNQNNVKVLETNLEATRDQFQIGDLTRTDVAQSEARLQLGRSQLAAAQGTLKRARRPIASRSAMRRARSRRRRHFPRCRRLRMKRFASRSRAIRTSSQPRGRQSR